MFDVESKKILDRIIEDLPKITTANGYYHNLKASQIYKTLFKATAFPTVMVNIGIDTAGTINESDSNAERVIDFHILVNFKVDKDVTNAGLLTDEQLKWRSDISAWVHGKFGRDKSFKVGAVPSIQHRWVDTQDPFLDHSANTGVELTILRITYNQNYDA